MLVEGQQTDVSLIEVGGLHVDPSVQVGGTLEGTTGRKLAITPLLMSAEGIGAKLNIGLGDLAVGLTTAVGMGQEGIIRGVNQVIIGRAGRSSVLLENSLPVRLGDGVALVGGQGLRRSLGIGLVAYDACAAGDEGDGYGNGRNEDKGDRNDGNDAFFGHGKFSFLLIFE